MAHFAAGLARPPLQGQTDHRSQPDYGLEECFPPDGTVTDFVRCLEQLV